MLLFGTNRAISCRGALNSTHRRLCASSAASFPPFQSSAKQKTRANPRNYWAQIERQRALFDQIGRNLALSSPEQWYKVKIADIYEQGGGYVIRSQYGSSLFDALKVIYPEHLWLPWRFSAIPKRLWSSKGVRNKFREYAMRQLRLSSTSEWQSVSAAQIAALGGRGLLSHYGGSIRTAMQMESDSSSMNSSPDLRAAMDTTLQTLYSSGVIPSMNLREFYNIKSSELRRMIQVSLIRPHATVNRAIMAAYPEHHWRPWLFRSITRADVDHSLAPFLNWAAEKLGISGFDDWYQVSYRQLMALCDDSHGRPRTSLASPFLRRYENSPAAMIMAAFPEYHWNVSLFNAKTPTG